MGATSQYSSLPLRSLSSGSEAQVKAVFFPTVSTACCYPIDTQRTTDVPFRRKLLWRGKRAGLKHSAALNGKTSLSTFQPCKAMMNDDSGRAISGDSVLLNAESLERELQIAIEQENYTEAANIRDRIRLLHEDSESSVLATNARFYNAFRSGDLASMQNLWAPGDNVCCVHPGASGIFGYELVMRSWEYVWVDYEFPLEIELRDVQVHVRGDMGYVMCVELVRTKGNSWGRQFATNVFERVDGQWFICVHHACPVDL